jgi:peptidyl-prolyl cis-trans isomerase B (cyclophilin B)
MVMFLSESEFRVPANRRAEVDAALKDVDFAKNTYQVQLDTTLGTILLDLYPDLAPGHCQNIIGLAKIGFYDGIIFHRVIAGFMAQVGCPDGRGTGGPGYTIRAEFNKTPHEAGTLSMARTSDPNSAGSQVFLCLARVPHLDNQYTVFGKTANEASLKVLLSIGAVETDGNDKPRKEVKITKGSVLVKAK